VVELSISLATRGKARILGELSSPAHTPTLKPHISRHDQTSTPSYRRNGASTSDLLYWYQAQAKAGCNHRTGVTTRGTPQGCLLSVPCVLDLLIQGY
jgi:hypothetical protein